MLTKMKMNVQGVERVRFKTDDGGMYEAGKVYAQSEYVNQPNKLGVIPSILECPVDIIDSLRELHFPHEYELEVELRSGAKNKAVMFVKSFVELGKTAKRNPA
ncbi:MAG: hypothetical protein HQL72_14880 [Magnetococcales bacterium]|nr:hypothetical protein [Magnetococcales bacterium]